MIRLIHVCVITPSRRRIRVHVSKETFRCVTWHMRSRAHIHGTTQPHDTTRSYVPCHITLMSCNTCKCHTQTHPYVPPWMSLGVSVISSRYIRISRGNVTPKLIHMCHVTSHSRLDLLICATSHHTHVICHTRMSHLHSFICVTMNKSRCECDF